MEAAQTAPSVNAEKALGPKAMVTKYKVPKSCKSRYPLSNRDADTVSQGSFHRLHCAGTKKWLYTSGTVIDSVTSTTVHFTRMGAAGALLFSTRKEKSSPLSTMFDVISGFELPYNIWCSGCGNHVGMGVRYNADKSRVGNYYSTPIWKFRMKCHLCDNYIEFQTDPKNCDYIVLSGATRHNQRWEQQDNEGLVVEKGESSKMAEDPMYKLEHGIKDQKKANEEQPRLTRLEEMQSAKKDDFAINQLLRKKFRTVKKDRKQSEDRDNILLSKASLNIPLVEENPDDVRLATTVKFHSQLEGLKEKRHALKLQSIFSSKNGSTSSRLVSNTRVVDHRNFRPLVATRDDAGVRVVRKRKHSQQDDNVSMCKAKDASSIQNSVILVEKSLVSDEYGNNTDSDS